MTLPSVEVLYGLLLAIPVYFIAYSLIAFRTHWRDGIEKHSSVLSSTQVLKILLIIFLVCINLWNLLEVFSPQDYDMAGIVIRAVFYLANTISWVLSVCLLVFEFNRRLSTTWFGHRGFWMASFFANFLKLFLQVLRTQDSDFIGNEHLRLWVYSFSCFFNFILAILAIFKPNDFQVSLVQPIYEPLLNERTSKIMRKNALSDEFTADVPILAVSISDFKVKHINSKSTIQYIIVVRVDGKGHIAKRTLFEFDSLHKGLVAKYKSAGYLGITLPNFPVISHNVRVEDTARVLNEYLNSLCKREFLCDVSLEFLDVKGKPKKEILADHKSFLEQHVSNFLNNNAQEEEQFKSFVCNYTSVKIVRFFSKEDHIEFQIDWKILSTGETGTVNRRYSEFYCFNQLLCKRLGPAEVPEFPTRGYMSLSKNLDAQISEFRRNKLQEYLREMLNDPAYLTTDALTFIKARSSREQVWGSVHIKDSLRLHRPLSWEPEIDDEGQQFIVYNICVEMENLVWTVRRRYNEFSYLHKRLKKRIGSPATQDFCNFFSTQNSHLPRIPKKTIAPLCTPNDIELRREGLESFLSEILISPVLSQSYEFKLFVQPSFD